MMTAVTWRAYSARMRPKLQYPASDHLVRNVRAAFGQELLDVAVAEWEAQIIRDGAADYVRRKLVAGV
jgi:hypothetical protein